MGRIRIAVVEDESIVADDIQRRLMDLGYDVPAITASGEDAVAMAVKDRPDLILMDIVLQGRIDGIEAAERIHSTLDVPIVFLTAHADKHTLERAMVAGPYGYIIKPFEERLLQITIEMALYKHAAERRLREGEEKYKNLVELTSDIIYILDNEGKSVFMNDAAYRILGRSPEEVIGRPFIDLIHPEDRMATLERWQEMSEKGPDVLTFENRYMAKAGKSIAVLHNVRLLRNAAGEFAGTQGIARDITERKRTEEELAGHREHLKELVEERTNELRQAVMILTDEISSRKSAEATLREGEARFRVLSKEFNTLLDAIPDTLLLLSPDLIVCWANKGAAAEFSRDVSEVAGRHCYELWHDRASPCDACHVLKSFQTGTAELSQRSTPDGRLLDSRAFPIRDDDGKVSNVILIVTDITQKAKLQAEAMRTSHLASLGELAAGVAHEINNPINGIINYAQIMANKTTRGSSENDIAVRIIKEGDRIAGIVRNLLSFARERREDKVPVSVGAILREAISLTDALIRKDGIHLTVDIPPDLPEVMANSQQLEQVFLNIIGNSRYALNRKYSTSNEEKRITISGEKGLLEGMPCVRVTVHDQGSGIPADILNKVMHPFFSTKPGGQGTGLGLSISHGIINDHKGRITIESVEGESTKVIIDLPAGGRNDA